MSSFSFPWNCVVWDLYVRVLGDVLICFRNLCGELSYMTHAKNLRFHYLWIDSQCWPNSKGSRFTSSIFALGNQIMELAFDRFCNQWNGDSLNLWRFQETHLLLDTLLNFSWDFEVFFVIPRCLVIDKGACNIFGVFVLHKFNIFSHFLLECLMLLRLLCFFLFGLLSVLF